MHTEESRKAQAKEICEAYKAEYIALFCNTSMLLYRCHHGKTAASTRRTYAFLCERIFIVSFSYPCRSRENRRKCLCMSIFSAAYSRAPSFSLISSVTFDVPLVPSWWPYRANLPTKCRSARFRTLLENIGPIILLREILGK